MGSQTIVVAIRIELIFIVRIDFDLAVLNLDFNLFSCKPTHSVIMTITGDINQVGSVRGGLLPNPAYSVSSNWNRNPLKLKIGGYVRNT